LRNELERRMADILRRESDANMALAPVAELTSGP
jgi:hypothetical protein